MSKLILSICLAVIGGYSALGAPTHAQNATHPQYNRTIADLMQKQTETIKQIVSHQQSHQGGRPQPLHQQGGHHQPTLPVNHQNSDKVEKFTLEELKIKCQHLSKLATASATKNLSEPQAAATPNVQIVHPATHYPTITPKPTSGFYITTKSATPPPAPVGHLQPPQNVKFIKLEPVILQKTVLADGRTIYYWHKTLPGSAPQFYYPPPPPAAPPTTTTTTTTTEASGLYFRNFFPSFYPIGGAESSSAATTEKATTAPPPTTTPGEHAQQPDLAYRQQLKFVVPVPYEANGEEGGGGGGGRKPWEFDQFAYYPKQLQPDTINLRVPYVPTFHVIKAVAVPDQYEGYATQEGAETSLDNVNIYS